jgi:hypothetical protein
MVPQPGYKEYQFFVFQDLPDEFFFSDQQLQRHRRQQLHPQ